MLITYISSFKSQSNLLIFNKIIIFYLHRYKSDMLYYLIKNFKNEYICIL